MWWGGRGGQGAGQGAERAGSRGLQGKGPLSVERTGEEGEGGREVGVQCPRGGDRSVHGSLIVENYHRGWCGW